jgi:hypothetical protein
MDPVQYETLRFAKSPNKLVPNYRKRVYFACGCYGPDNKKKVAKISLSDQILLFIVQREAIVDITGTLREQR